MHDLTTRNATLDDLARLLMEQQARKLDVVAPATAISAVGGMLRLRDAETVFDETGFTDPNGLYLPTAVCDEGIAEKLGVPVAYLRRLRAERSDLYDANVNGWLQGTTNLDSLSEPHADPDRRSFLLRTFWSEDGPGVARAFLSNGYRAIDNLDVLTAALDGVRQAGVPVEVQGCDLTERRMYVRVFSPVVAELADVLLRGYRNPFDDDGRRPGAVGRQLGAAGHEYRPGVVFGGFEISNSEVGDGAFTITPRIVVPICSNGLKITRDALRQVHLGARLDHGVVIFGDDTQRKNLELVTAQARDAVATFLDPGYVRGKIEELTEKADRPVADAARTVEVVSKRLAFGKEHTAGVLDFFIRGGQVTAGGVMQAVTAYSQTVGNADEAADLEAKAVDALDVAASA